MSAPRRDWLWVWGLALLVRVLAALPQTQPNYMDAAYYTVGGQQLARGFGFNDPYVWNYLDAPTSLPHPSHLYWMPLPSILAALSQSVFGVTYRAAQLPFVLLSTGLPLIAYGVAWQVGGGRRRAWLAALFTIFSPFYLPYWGVPESFTPFAVCGALAVWLGSRPGLWPALAAGAGAGLAHLSRADGFLLLVPIVLGVQPALRERRAVVARSLAVLAGYLLIMTPWFARNLSVIGAPLSGAGTQAAFVCNYDELFALDAHFDLNHLLGCGLNEVLASRINGVASGAVHLLAEGGMIFLGPLIAVGWWLKRREPVFRAALIYLVLLFFTMTIVFPFAGDRGGLFHSLSALLPFGYAAAPIGLDAAIAWLAARRRAWRAAEARRVFSVALAALALIMGLVVYRGRVIGADLADPIWNQADGDYRTIGQWLRANGAGGQGEVDPIVVVNNPPGFTYQTGLRSIVIPNGDEAALLAAARRFGAGWVVLDQNRPAPLAGLYAAPDSSADFSLLATFDGAHVLKVVAP